MTKETILNSEQQKVADTIKKLICKTNNSEICDGGCRPFWTPTEWKEWW
mgnify:CR=1 FL=1